MAKVDYRLDDLDGVQEVALGQVALARKALGRGRVHDLRKATKRLRAILRLVRTDIGTKRARKDDRLIRDIPRAAAPARDTEVMAALFDELAVLLPGPAREVAAFQETLRLRVFVLHEQRDDAAIATGLQDLVSRIGRWEAGDAGVRAGFERAIELSRDSMRTADRLRTAEALHLWRKEVKYHWHHCELLGDETRAKHVHGLSDVLGDEHDLIVLLEQAHDLAGLQQIVASRRLALHERAFELGHELFTMEEPHSQLSGVNRRLAPVNP